MTYAFLYTNVNFIFYILLPTMFLVGKGNTSNSDKESCRELEEQIEAGAIG